jgi:hypothetical protein
VVAADLGEGKMAKEDSPSACGSNPAPITRMNYQNCISGTEVFALLWELSNCLERNNAWVGSSGLSLVASYLGYAVSCELRPSNLLSVSGSPWRGSHYAFIRACRGKRAHPIYRAG